MILRDRINKPLTIYPKRLGLSSTPFCHSIFLPNQVAFLLSYTLFKHTLWPTSFCHSHQQIQHHPPLPLSPFLSIKEQSSSFFSFTFLYSLSLSPSKQQQPQTQPSSPSLHSTITITNMPSHPHPFPSPTTTTTTTTTTNNTIKQNFLPPPPQATFSTTTQRNHQRLLPPHRKTNPLVWCGAIFCFFFSLLLILSGILTLIIFLFIKPRNPSFDIPNASLNTIVLLSPFYLNADLTFLANFSNPNHKLDLIFDYASIELYFSDRLIAAQGLPPFTQRRGEQRLEAVHMISSEVYFPSHLALELQKQAGSNSVVYNIRGTFKVKVSFGVFHFTYWLYSRCFIQLTAPPSGVLIGRTCKTNK